MRTIKLVLAFCCLAVLAAVFPAAAQDLTIVFKETSKAGETKTAQYFTKERVRHNMGDHDSIVEYATGKMIHIDHKKKEYSETTLAEIEAQMQKMSAEMEKANAQMKKQLESMPPAMREKMEQMMGGAAGAVTVTKGATRRIAGYDTQQYTVSMGQNLKTETWNTTALKFPVPEVDVKRVASYAGSLGPMMNNPMFKGIGKLTEEMKKIQGIALAETTTFQIMGKASTTSKEAVEVKQGPVPASVFEIPAGYKKVASPTAKMGKKE